MTDWTADTLAQIVQADDLHVSPFRHDGTTYGTPTWIWCVAVDGELYVRAFNGQHSRWYQAAIEQGAGRIHAAGQQYEVTFAPAPAAVNEAVDAAYEAKYHGSQYLPPMLTDAVRAATVTITLREDTIR